MIIQAHNVYDVGDGIGGCGGAGNAAVDPSTTISGVAVAFAAVVIGTATSSDDVDEEAPMDASAAYPDITIYIDYGA